MYDEEFDDGDSNKNTSITVYTYDMVKDKKSVVNYVTT